MGHVHIETRNEGRGLHEYDYVCLGEQAVVQRLIKKRSQIDVGYYAKKSVKEDSAISSHGVFPFSEPIICVYVDLDRLVETCGLSEVQDKVVKMLMDGNSTKDVAEFLEITEPAVFTHLKRASHKICRKNNQDWEETNKK